MNLACVRPIVYNFTYLLSSCSTISDLCRGREIDDARKMFDRMPARDLVARNTIVSGYSQNGLALQALDTVLRLQADLDTVLRLQADGKMCEGLIQKAKDGGLDVVETNIFWNGHEPSPGSYNFEGRYDLVRFIKIVQNVGLYAHIRIGPHVCAK